MPINALVDGRRGDDWFHNGAFRQDSPTYAHGQEATRGSDVAWWTDHYDDYDSGLWACSAGDMTRLHGLEKIGFAARLMNHTTYDDTDHPPRVRARSPPNGAGSAERVAL